jgi:dTDP-glucose 4,6-dehydratase
MRLLVTGGSGFIGSNFIHYMLHKYPQYEIWNLDALTYCGCEMNNDSIRSHKNYKFIKGDICDPKIVDELVSQVDMIINFAADTHVDNSIANAMPFVMTNVMGTFNLLESALRNGKKRFHQISTDEVFGDLGPSDSPFDEHSSRKPRNPYSASKAAADHLVMSYFHTHRLPVTLSNCSNNYGPYQFPEKFIPRFVTTLSQGEKVPLYGDGRNIRDWIHVDDHSRAVDAIIHKGAVGETYCVGSQNDKTNIEITRLILKHLGMGEEYIEFVQDRQGHDRRYSINSAKLQSDLGWSAQVPFEDGLKQTIDWYKQNHGWWKAIKDGEHKKMNESYS